MLSSFFRRLRIRSLGLIALLFTLTVIAQAADATSLTFAEALARVTERNPVLAAHNYAGRAADALVEQAALRPNPTVEVGLENILGTGRVQGVRSSETTVQASQTFERAGKRDKRVTLAARERDVATQEFAVRRAEVLAAAAQAYIAAVAAQERLALAAETPRLARETVAVIQQHQNAGVASSVELARARATLASTQADQTRADANLTAARATLAANWGGTASEITSFSGSLRVPETLPSPDLFRTQLTAHPRLAWQTAIIASRRAALALEQAHAAPDVTASGGVRFLREGSDAAFVAGVSVPLPIRNKNQGNIRASRETLAGAEHSARALEAELQAAFASAWQDLAAAHAAAQALRRDALPATEEAYTAVRRAYDAGPIPLTDVLDTQRALLALRRELLEAEASYAAALVRLESLTNSSFPATAALLSSR